MTQILKQLFTHWDTEQQGTPCKITLDRKLLDDPFPMVEVSIPTSAYCVKHVNSHF